MATGMSKNHPRTGGTKTEKSMSDPNSANSSNLNLDVGPTKDPAKMATGES